MNFILDSRATFNYNFCSGKLNPFIDIDLLAEASSHLSCIAVATTLSVYVCLITK